jgi:predicted lipoprotein with Yx(FWY)xxD motif
MRYITQATTGLRPSLPRRKRRFGVGMWALAAGTATIGLSVAALAGTASAANRPAATPSTSHVVVTMKTVKSDGKVLFDQEGFALYIDMSDKPPHFACTGACLTFWPALVLPKGQKVPAAGKGVTDLGAIKSPEGMQVTWRGKPLYTYAADSKGTVHGQGIKQWGLWWAAGSKKAQSAVPAKMTTAPGKTTGTTSSGSWG